jgi:hypothetical protein
MQAKVQRTVKLFKAQERLLVVLSPHICYLHKGDYEGQQLLVWLSFPA